MTQHKKEVMKKDKKPEMKQRGAKSADTTTNVTMGNQGDTNLTKKNAGGIILAIQNPGDTDAATMKNNVLILAPFLFRNSPLVTSRL